MGGKLSARTRLYLEAVTDWKADYEVAELIGDSPPPARVVVRQVLGRLMGRGLVTWNGRNNVYRITPAGSALIANKDAGNGNG